MGNPISVQVTKIEEALPYAVSLGGMSRYWAEQNAGSASRFHQVIDGYQTPYSNLLFLDAGPAILLLAIYDHQHVLDLKTSPSSCGNGLKHRSTTR